ncbi:2603_t:CDS:2 [Entrophospora sp. SA101]|nr:2603_t:CDS:2 [Entrophospora sp. SA101]
MESEGTSLFAISPKASLLTANSLFTKDIFSSTYNSNDFNNLKQPGFTYSSDQRQFKSSLRAPSSILSSTNTNNNISSSSDMWAAPGSSNRPSSNVTHRKIIDDIIFYRPDSHIALDNLTSTFDPFKSDNTTKNNIVLDPSKNEEETNEDFRSNVTQPYNINNIVTPEILTSRFEPFKYNNIANTNVTFDPFNNDITILDHQLGNGTSNNFNRSVSANDKYLGGASNSNQSNNNSINPRDLNDKSPLCKHFQRGYCAKGDHCQYLHKFDSYNSINKINGRNLGHASYSTHFSLSQQPCSYNQFHPSINNASMLLNNTSSINSNNNATSNLYGPYNHHHNINSSVNSPANINDITLPTVNTVNHINCNNNNKIIPYIQKYPQHRTFNNIDHPINHINVTNLFNHAIASNSLNQTNTRFSGVDLENFAGQIYSLCKDQHGCRFLQKKLEENNQSYIDMIFNEVYKHFVELITDTFGNYLCQKLFEYCDENKRTTLVKKVSSDLVNISLNVHGTRAVQKIIELVTENKHDYAKYIYKTQQICTLIQSLNSDVVTLIQDLNGNHVIQKCLRLFTPEENQFIYNAVSSNCLEVATHKNGCCVFQRCIDNGTKQQRILLLRTIIHHALTLSQDKYGNYVVQYAINFNNQQFTNALSRKILGHVYVLSIQQCSSNVVEALLISEIINCHHIDRLLQDSFGNYVIQTALSQAGLDQKAELIKHLQPFLTTIDNAPYGKKISDLISQSSQVSHDFVMRA